MPRRRRSEKRRRNPAGPYGDMFVESDGVTAFWAGDVPYEYSNVFLARAAWEECRESTWGMRYRLWPPKGAIAYDGITELTSKHHPTGRGRAWDLEEMRQAVEADVASVEVFRKAEPVKAAAIAEHLDDYVADLRYLLALAEGAEPNDHGYFNGLRNAWDAYDVRRTDELRR